MMSKVEAIDVLKTALEDRLLGWTKDPEMAQEEAESIVEELEAEGFFEDFGD